MTAAFVREAEVWPEAGPLTLEIANVDGEYAHMFSPAGAEVIILGPYESSRQRLVIPIGFATFEQAQRAGRILADAFAAVQEIHAETPPDPATCEHRAPPRLLGRLLTRTAVCELCGATVEDVDG